MTEQLSHDDLKGMTFHEINAARKAGKLNEVMSSPNPDRQGGYRHNGNNLVGQPRDMKTFIAKKQAEKQSA